MSKPVKRKAIKKKTAPNVSSKSPSYLREVQIRFKKKRVKNDSPIRTVVTESQQIYKLFKDLQNETKEKLITISLDAKLKIICFEIVAIGSLNSLYARPAEAIRSSIPLNSYAIIVVHNHPSGDPSPSPQDHYFTARLLFDCENLGINFCDHIIIGENGYFSFADENLIEQFCEELIDLNAPAQIMKRVMKRIKKRK